MFFYAAMTHILHFYVEFFIMSQYERNYLYIEHKFWVYSAVQNSTRKNSLQPYVPFVESYLVPYMAFL